MDTYQGQKSENDYKGRSRADEDPRYFLGDSVTVNGRVVYEVIRNFTQGHKKLEGATGVVRDRWVNPFYLPRVEYTYLVEFTKGGPGTPAELFGPEESEVRLLIDEQFLGEIEPIVPTQE